MAYDREFELRIAEALIAQGVQAETVKMFGGIIFMVRGNMSVGITSKGDLLVKFGPERHAEACEWLGAKPFTMGKGDGKGILLVDVYAVGSRKALEKWVTLSVDHIQTLPTKAPKAKRHSVGKRVAKGK